MINNLQTLRLRYKQARLWLSARGIYAAGGEVIYLMDKTYPGGWQGFLTAYLSVA